MEHESREGAGDCLLSCGQLDEDFRTPAIFKVGYGVAMVNFLVSFLGMYIILSEGVCSLRFL